MKNHPKMKLMPYMLILPTLLMLGGIFLYPIIIAIRLSLYDAPLPSLLGAKYIGFQNYWNILLDSSFWNSVKLTLIYTVFTVGGAYLIGLYLAYLLNNNFKGRFLARGILIIPWALPDLAAVLVWGWMFDPQYGILNYFLGSLGIVKQNFLWLSNPDMVMVSILLVTIWKWFPFSSLMLLAGFQSIPQELYEAANIDGANRVQSFRYVTLPGLSNVSKILLLLLSIWSFGNFVLIYLFTGGGPSRATETLAIQVYLDAFLFNKVGRACALGIILLLIAVIFTIFYFKFVLKEEPSE